VNQLKNIFSITLILNLIALSPALAWEENEEIQEEFLEPKILIRPEHKRGLFWPQFGSLLLPGLDQWMENQHKSAIVYSGGAYLGLQLVVDAMTNLQKSGVTEDKDYFVNLGSRNDDLRNLMMGSHIYSTMGYMSAYHSFRTAALSYETTGKFAFLPKDEKPLDLLLAPIDFTHLTKLRTVIPLGLLALALSRELKSDSTQHNSYSIKDQLYATGFSYGAGVGEEMVFRGWFMPMFYESWGSEIGANLFTSTVFALGHITASNKTPTAQFILGYYFGYLALANNWSLRESVFLHTWWDILIFSANYLDASTTKEASIYLPLLSLSF
jgi:membrane protease YdiL (CAAX protease family)